MRNRVSWKLNSTNINGTEQIKYQSQCCSKTTEIGDDEKLISY